MNFKFNKRKIGIKTSLTVVVLSSMVTMILVLLVSPEYLRTIYHTALEAPALAVLNYLPVLLVMLLFYFISGNCVFASGIPALIFIDFSYANSVKSTLRQDPLIPSDLSVVTEVGSIISTYGSIYTVLAIIAIILFAAVIAVAFLFFKGSDALTAKKRIAGSFICIFCLFGMTGTLYSSTSLYDSFPVIGNIYFKVNQYMSKGFIYSFLYDLNNLKVNSPEGYNSAEFTDSDIKTDAAGFEDVSKPNIIMVMSEAFSDISNSDFLSFDGFDDPLEFFNDFITRDDVISGHIVVPNFGGGTSDTEFDVLTGCSTKYVDSTQVSYNFIRSPMESLPSILESVGYDTLAIHPGYGWFYNRINVYENMGFDDFIYLEEDFDPTTQNKGGYISDQVTTGSIIENFEAHTQSSDSPLFEFCVTIQNHGPYEEKYDDLETNFTTDIELTDEEKAIYSGYFEGIDDADAQIEELVNYFETSDEPVVLVFFGDHLPGFSNGMTYFSQFRQDIDVNGEDWQQLNAYETPYFIWANEAALNETDFAQNAELIDLPSNHIISSFYLGTTVLEILDLDGISPFYEYVNELRRILPVASASLFMYPDGTITDTITEDEQEMVSKYKRWIYYKLFDEDTVL